ncbi:MAG: DinB family protein [Planctomycetota bacterium]|jgi:uncharacterized damage-inducible protein DinB
MYTAEALLDLHERAHQSLAKLLAHCRQLDADELSRELQGFGYSSVRLQLHHLIGAEQYWIGVLEGRVDAGEDDADYPTVESLETYRRQVSSATEECLRSSSTDELNTARRMLTWGDREQVLAPARVVIRTQTHIYQHLGQIVAMCRILEKPAPGMDFPIVENQ